MTLGPEVLGSFALFIALLFGLAAKVFLIKLKGLLHVLVISLSLSVSLICLA